MKRLTTSSLWYNMDEGYMLFGINAAAGISTTRPRYKEVAPNFVGGA